MRERDGRNFGQVVYSGIMSNENGEISERQKPVVNKKLVAGAGGLAVAQLLNFGAPVAMAATENISAEDKLNGEIPSKVAFDNFFAENGGAVETEKKETKNRGVFQQGDRFYEINGVVYEGETPTTVYKSRTVGPARFVGRALGIPDTNITFDAKTKIATFTKESTVVKIKQNSCDYWVNGVKKKSDVEAIVKEGRTLVPFRLIAEAFGGVVGYDNATRMVFIGYSPSEQETYLENLAKKYENAYDVGLKYVKVPTDIGPEEDLFEIEPYTGKTVMFSSDYASRVGEFNDAMGKSLIPTVAKNLDKSLGVEFFYGSDKEVYGFGPNGAYLLGKDGKGTKIDLPVPYSNTNSIKAVEDGENSGVYVVDKNGKLLDKYNSETKLFASETLTSDKLAVETAKPYIAGGEFLGDNVPYKIDIGSTGVVRIYSGKDISATEKAAFDKAEKKCKKNDVMCVVGGEIYVFNQQNTKSAKKINSNGEVKEISYNSGLSWDYSRLTWNKNMGIGVSNGYKITHQYNSKSNTWAELDEYVMLGTPEQRVDKSLVDALNGSISVNGATVKNPLSLDANEVEEYLKTGVDNGSFNTFKVAKDGYGKPAFVIPVGTENGFSKEYGNLSLGAVNRWNEIDPGFIRYLVDRFGMNFFTKDMGKRKTFAGKDDYLATFNICSFGGVILFNEDLQRRVIEEDVVDTTGNRQKEVAQRKVMGAYGMESRGLYDLMHMGKAIGVISYETTASDRLDINQGIDKALWLRNKAEGYKTGKLTNVEYNYFWAASEVAIRYYKARQ